MLDKIKFDRSLTALLIFKNVKENEDLTKMLYSMMKDDFTDEEFGNMCLEICKTEELYNKYPDPKLFYDRKKEKQADVLIEEGTFFLDDTIPEYRAVIDDLSTDQRDKICLDVWNWLMETNRGKMVSKQFIIDRLIQFRPPKREEFMGLTEIKKLLSDHENKKTTI